MVSLRMALMIWLNLLYCSRKYNTGQLYSSFFIDNNLYYLIYYNPFISYRPLLFYYLFDSASMFRYRLQENYAYSKVRLAIGQTVVQAKVAPHPLFAQVKSIQLKSDELNLKCLELMQKGEVQIAPQKSAEFVQRCKQVYNLQPELNITELGIGLMINSSDQDTNTLDILEFNDLLSVIKVAFDKTVVKLHSKVIRKIKAYVTNSKRRQSEKQILEKYLKSYKQTDQAEELQQSEKKPQNQQKKVRAKKEPTKTSKRQSEMLEIKQALQGREDQNVSEGSSQRIQGELAEYTEQQKPQLNNRKGRRDRNENADANSGSEIEQKERAIKQRNGRGRDNRSRQSRSKGGRSNDRFGSISKQKKYDPKIMLGISGDTQAGWRERHRPPRVPAGSSLNVERTNFSTQSNPKLQQKQSPSMVNSVRPAQVQMSERQSTGLKDEQKKDGSNANNKAGLLFTYPKDGEEFDFSRIKDSFRLFINGSFWVSFKNGVLEIKKGENGYIRDSKIDVIQNGFMAEGLTVRLGGSSNLEDGGDAIGSPVIKDFTNNPSQFFHVITLQIFRYEAENDQNRKQKKQQKPTFTKAKTVEKQLKNETVKVENVSQKKEHSKDSTTKQKKKPQNSDRQEDWEDEAGELEEDQQQKSQLKPSQKKGIVDKSSNHKKNHQPQPRQNYLKVDEKGNESRSKSKGNKSRSKSRGSQNNQQKSSRSKQKLDPEIELGIKGDSQVGWRERNRPLHVSPKINSEKPENHQNRSVEQKKITNNQSSPQKVQAQNEVNDVTDSRKTSGPLLLYETKGNEQPLFVYPKDGMTFDFNQVKKGFKIFINNKFWITYDGGKLEIKQGEKGYSRDSKIDVIRSGFMAEGLTINLEGASNIEDGGDVLGNPQIEDFTENKTQFFSVKSMEVYQL